MKRSFVPAGLFVLLLLVVAVGTKFYLQYEYKQVMETFSSFEGGYTISDTKTGKSVTVFDAETCEALSGFLGSTLLLEKSVNGKPKEVPEEVLLVQAAEGNPLTLSPTDPSVCYLKGRFFTHYFTGGIAVVPYLSELLQEPVA